MIDPMQGPQGPQGPPGIGPYNKHLFMLLGCMPKNNCIYYLKILGRDGRDGRDGTSTTGESSGGEINLKIIIVNK